MTLTPHSLCTRMLVYLLAAIVLVATVQALVAYRTALAEADTVFDCHMQQTALSLRGGVPFELDPNAPEHDEEIFALVRGLAVGTLGSVGGPSWTTALYFSAETYTSLGYGDVVPQGALRALAGVEALNGLLLIGWTASYTYVAMQHFWGDAAEAARD